MHDKSTRRAPRYQHHQDTERYLRTAEVAEILVVSPKTITRWAVEGWLPYQRTLGGHRRYPEPDIRALAERLREPEQPRTTVAVVAAHAWLDVPIPYLLTDQGAWAVAF